MRNNIENVRGVKLFKVIQTQSCDVRNLQIARHKPVLCMAQMRNCVTVCFVIFVDFLGRI